MYSFLNETMILFDNITLGIIIFSFNCSRNKEHAEILSTITIRDVIESQTAKAFLKKHLAVCVFLDVLR